MRRDPALFDQPPQHLRRSVGRVGDEPLGPKAETVRNALDHLPGRIGLVGADGAAGLDVDDDRVVGVDELVVRIFLGRNDKDDALRFTLDLADEASESSAVIGASAPSAMAAMWFARSLKPPNSPPYRTGRPI